MSAIDFALNLHREVCPLPKNGFHSPASILVTMAMCMLGGKGHTKSQMAKTLFTGNGQQSQSDEKINQYLIKLVQAMDKQDDRDNFLLRSANRLYGQKGFAIKDKYKNQLKQIFKSELVQADFQTQAESERVKINQWVADKTQKRIENLIGQGVLNADTRLVLVNALYLKAQWYSTFNAQETKDEQFHASADKNFPAKMMQLKKDLKYAENGDYQLVQLPYVNPSAKMIILLPKTRFGLKNVLSQMNGQNLEASLQSLKTYQVDLKLPKFTIEQSFSLNEALKKLGIKDAFDMGKADFSEIASAPLFISKVLHKAFVEINENGTEAAAATAAVMALRSGFVGNLEKKTFLADHPFLFAILGHENDHVFFMGQYYGQ